MAYNVKAAICNSSGQVFETIPVTLPAGVSINNTPTVDTELPAAIALGDLLATPTAPAVGAYLEAFHGPAWNAMRTVGAASGTTSGSVILGVGPLLYHPASARYFPANASDASGTAKVSDVHGVSTWQASGAADNATATATKTAEAGKSLFVDTILVSFSGTTAVTARLILRDGATEIGSHYVRNSDVIRLSSLQITNGNAFTAELGASGAGGTIGNVVVIGHTYQI